MAQVRIIGKGPGAGGVAPLSKATPAVAIMANEAALSKEDVLQCVEYLCQNTSETSAGQTWNDRKMKRFRCNCCNSYKKRVRTNLDIVSEDTSERFKSFTPDQKEKFKAENLNTLSADLPAALEIFVNEVCFLF